MFVCVCVCVGGGGGGGGGGERELWRRAREKGKRGKGGNLKISIIAGSKYIIQSKSNHLTPRCACTARGKYVLWVQATIKHFLVESTQLVPGYISPTAHCLLHFKSKHIKNKNTTQ